MTQLATHITKIVRTCSKIFNVGILALGRDAGKGGGRGVPVRKTGRSLGKIGKAREAQYFYNLQKQLLEELREKVKEENNLREEEIRKHQKAIDANKNLAKNLEEKINKKLHRKIDKLNSDT